MSKYGIFIGEQTGKLELARFDYEQTDSYKSWITAITGLVDSKAVGETGILMKGVRVSTFTKTPFAIRFYGDQAGLWEQNKMLNRDATVLLAALNKTQFFVGNILVLPDLGDDHREGDIAGWTRDEAVEVMKVLNNEIFYHLKYNYKRRHEHGGSPTHPQFYGREG